MSHYFDREPSSPSRRGEVELVLPDVRMTLSTDRGVFSAEAVDRGTKLLLLEGPPPPARGHLADLGCGYGPIAVTIALRAPAATVWAIDVNARARELTTANALQAGAGNVRVVEPDDVPGNVRMAALYSNPPVRIGKRPLQRLLTSWLGRLDAGGRAYLVVHKHLGADSLATWLNAEGWTVSRLRSRMGYRLLEVGAS
jgi:16S rRNA (guanine1207-N2)-methyltransferase